MCNYSAFSVDNLFAKINNKNPVHMLPIWGKPFSTEIINGMRQRISGSPTSCAMKFLELTVSNFVSENYQTQFHVGNV